MRTCIDCGGRIEKGSRCARDEQTKREERDPWRAAYSSELYRSNRRTRMAYAGGQCERILPNSSRCPEVAVETNHTIPLSSARTLAEALDLCDWQLLEAVCFDHNPRGG